MNGRIETWFPKSIYVCEDFSLDLISDLEKKILDSGIKKQRDTQLYVDSTHKVNREIHRSEPYQALSERILTEIKTFARALGYSEAIADLSFISSMWYNTSDKGDFIFPHNHAGGFISGAYYVSSVSENEIVFYDNLNDVYQPACEQNQLSFQTASYKCKPGRLLLWRSNFVHGTPVQLKQGKKIVISFNALLETNSTVNF
jgi:uncharacterized protein (TIGR02466 family)